MLRLTDSIKVHRLILSLLNCLQVSFKGTVMQIM